MEFVKDFLWKPGMKADEFIEKLSAVGFQSTELNRAANLILRMKKESAKIYLTFPSNLATSGLRGFFAQLIKLKIPDIVITTAGAIEEDIMRSIGERFLLGSFFTDDVALHEQGANRVGNILIKNESYEKFEDKMQEILLNIYKSTSNYPLAPSQLLHEIGKYLKDENSILYQASKNNIPVFCPAIVDGAIGFQLYLFAQRHKEFSIDPIKDFSRSLSCVSIEEKKGAICLGGGTAKHFAIFSALINGGLDYAVYITSSHFATGSVGGATTQEAKSWGKIKESSDAVTVYGDASVLFPIIMTKVLEELHNEGAILHP